MSIVLVIQKIDSVVLYVRSRRTASPGRNVRELHDALYFQTPWTVSLTRVVLISVVLKTPTLIRLAKRVRKILKNCGIGGVFSNRWKIIALNVFF